MKTPNLMFGLIMIMLGTISLILSVSPSPPYLCLAPQNICDAIYQQYQQYVVQNFIKYFLLGSASMTLSVIVLFLGRKKTKETRTNAGIKGYRPWFDNDS